MDGQAQTRLADRSFRLRGQCKHVCACVYNTRCFCAGPGRHTCVVTGVWHVTGRQTTARENSSAFSILFYNESQKRLAIKSWIRPLFSFAKAAVRMKKENEATRHLRLAFPAGLVLSRLFSWWINNAQGAVQRRTLPRCVVRQRKRLRLLILRH